MIHIQKLSKKYGNIEVLHDINLSLPRFGLVVIYGDSGCGKTSLLNCISGLLPFEGHIIVDSKSIEKMDDDDLSSFRLKTYGFVFQDFKLYENETIIDNVMFPLDVLTNLRQERKLRKCHDVLDLVNLNKNDKQIVSELSGGEKQRVAIARSLVNDPKIIIADEPTGALDYANGTSVMEILEKISLRSLVLLVSHDKELTEKYADEIIEMEDGKIKNIKFNAHHKHDNFLPILKNGISNKKPKISASFLFHHTLHSIKQRKWRTMICSTVTSLGLIGVGLSITLSSTISSNLKQAYASFLGDSQIIVSLKENNYMINQSAGSYYEALDIKKNYSDFVIDVGVDYYANFEEYFPDCNNVVFADIPSYTPIEGLSVRHINEFEWLDVIKPIVYPSTPSSMRDDELILGLTIDMIRDMCFALHIERNVDSLSDYIVNNDLKIYFDIANNSWSYWDQQIFTIKGFVLQKDICIYHLNHLWNEYVLEECMRFPTTDTFESTSSLPWIMKKLPYLYINDEIDKFFELSLMDQAFDNYILELANATYYPWMLNNSNPKDIRRVLFFFGSDKVILNRYTDYFLKTSNNIHSPIFGNSYGYSIFGQSLMMGFTNYTYFAFDEDKLDEVIDANSILQVDSNETIALNNGVLCGHYSKSMQDGVVFKPLSNQNIKGRKPNNLDEIVVSSKFLEQLNEKDISKDLYLASCIFQRTMSNGKIYKEYRKISLKIVGVINDEDHVAIYHNSSWTTSFFRSRVGISSFNLLTTSISFSVVDQNKNDETIKALQKAFPRYEINNPLKDINESVESVCKYIGLALALFSIVAFIISVLLLSICNYLHILESKKEIGLARCIGVNKKESKRFLFWHSYFMSFLSFIFSFIELIAVSYVSDFAISQSLSSTLDFSINPLAVFAMLGLCVVVSIFISIFVTNSISKTNPLDALKK